MLGLFIGFANDWLYMKEYCTKYCNLIDNFSLLKYLNSPFVHENYMNTMQTFRDMCPLSNISNALINIQ